MTDEIEKNENDEIVPEEIVWSMVEFARSLQSSMYGNVFTPDLLNQNLKNISYNPAASTQAELDKYLQNPKQSESQLISLGQNLELTSMPYKRLLMYLGNLLAFDYTITCSNAEEKDYKTPAYQKDLDKVWDFFDKFNVKQEFGVAVKQMLRNEAFFFMMRMDGDKYVLQELDNSYCKIVSRFDYGLLMDFNMLYFLNPGIDIKMFPDFFLNSFNEMMTKSNRKYVPDLPVDLRGESSWAFWQSVPPQEGMVFKMSSETGVRLPFFTGLFADLLIQPLMRTLQKNKSISACSKLIFGEVGLLNRDQKTTLKDAISISPDLLGKFMTLMRNAIAESIKIAASPLQNVQGISFDPGEDVLQQNLETTLASSGVNTNLIFTSGVKPNLLETQLSLNTDEQMCESIYPMLNNFLNYRLGMITKRFKFKVVLEGTNFFTNREQRLAPLQTLMTSGIVLPQKIAAAIGMEPHVFQKQMEEARATGFVDSLTPIIPATNIAAGNQGGRPQKPDSVLSEGGEQTRSDGGNLGRGGKSLK